MNYDPKDPSEEINYGVDFAPLLETGETVSTAAASIRVISGTDANSAAMLSGSVSVSGSIASVKIINGVVGCVYRVGFTATTSSGQKFIEGADLAVIDRD